MQAKRNLNAYRGVLKDKKLASVLQEALQAPVGSTKRKQAQKVLSILRKTSMDGKGGPGPAVPRIQVPYRSYEQDYTNFVVFPNTPKIRVPFGEDAPTPKPMDGQGYSPVFGIPTSSPGFSSPTPQTQAVPYGNPFSSLYKNAIQPAASTVVNKAMIPTGNVFNSAIGAGIKAFATPVTAPYNAFANPVTSKTMQSPLAATAQSSAMAVNLPNNPMAIPTQQEQKGRILSPEDKAKMSSLYGSPTLAALGLKTGNLENATANLKTGETGPAQGSTDGFTEDMMVAGSTPASQTSGIGSRFSGVQSAVDANMGPTMFALDAMNRGADYLKTLPGFENMPDSMLNGGASLSGRIATIDEALRKQYSLDEMLNSFSELVKGGQGLEGRLIDYVRGRDEFLNETNGLIDDLKKRSAKMDMSDPRTQQNVNQHFNYLYEMRGRQNKRYIEFVKMSVDEYTARTNAAEQLYNVKYNEYANVLQQKTALTTEEYNTMLSGLQELYTTVAEAPARQWEALQMEQSVTKTYIDQMKEMQELEGLNSGNYQETYKNLQTVKVLDDQGRWQINNHAISIAGSNTYDLLRAMDDGIYRAFNVPDKEGVKPNAAQIQQIAGNALGHLALMKSSGLIDDQTYNSYSQNIKDNAIASLTSENRMIGDDKVPSYIDAVKSLAGSRGLTFWNKTPLTRQEFLSKWSNLDSNILNAIYTDMEGFKNPQEFIDTFMTSAGELGQGGGTIEDVNTIKYRLINSYVSKMSPQQISGQMGFNRVGGGTNQASKIAQAIKQVESGGNYGARGGSGEYGAYQFMPNTWKQWAGKYLGNPNAPLTQQNQDLVATSHITTLLKQGYSPEQIALIWNGGEPKVKRGVNQWGVQYDSGAYARKVMAEMQQYG